MPNGNNAQHAHYNESPSEAEPLGKRRERNTIEVKDHYVLRGKIIHFTLVPLTLLYCHHTTIKVLSNQQQQQTTTPQIKWEIILSKTLKSWRQKTMLLKTQCLVV